MARKCKVCDHPAVSKIDALLLAKERIGKIATKYDISTQSIVRHRVNGHIDIGPAVIAKTREKAFTKRTRPTSEHRHLTTQNCHIKLGNYIAALESLVAKYLKSSELSENLVCIKAISEAAKVVLAIIAQNNKDLERCVLQLDSIPGETEETDEQRVSRILDRLSKRLEQTSNA